jgi:hypothetical protein
VPWQSLPPPHRFSIPHKAIPPEKVIRPVSQSTGAVQGTGTVPFVMGDFENLLKTGGFCRGNINFKAEKKEKSNTFLKERLERNSTYFGL